MPKVALYRKYRPQDFDELFGQDHVAKTLKNSVKNGNFSHAYLFCGPRGTGKTSAARILAKAINCDKNKNGNPDNACDSCKSINTEKVMDVIEIDAASHTQVENIREVIVERAGFAPTSLKYKVYIIDEAHMLSKSSFNALLKTLEEPPAHTIFILATTEANKILPTIISRCQRFDFKRIGKKDLISRLEYIAGKEGVKVDEKALEMMADISEGGFRDAISLLDQMSQSKGNVVTVSDIEEILGVSNLALVKDFATALIIKDSKQAIAALSKMVEDGNDPKQFYRETIEFFRKVMIAKYSSEENGPLFLAEKTEETVELLRGTKGSAIIRIIDELVGTESAYKYSSIPQLSLEVAAMKICNGEISVPEAPKQEIKAIHTKAKTEESNTVAPEKQSTKKGNGVVKWQELLLEIKGRNNSIHAFLKVSEPEFKDEETALYLHFPYKFHKERIEDIKNRRIVEEALTKVYGQDYKVVCLLKPLNSAAPIQSKKNDDLLEDALEIFGGEVIE